jgi:hypothetical protein
VDTGKRFSIGYGTGNLSGNVVTDSINIAGLPLNAHTLGVATMESVEFSSNTTAFDGIMGLAPSVSLYSIGRLVVNLTPLVIDFLCSEDTDTDRGSC